MQTDRSSSQTNSSTDQAIQTSILLDSSNSPMNSRFQSTPTPGTRHISSMYSLLKNFYRIQIRLLRSSFDVY
jgi:hypothetical protein